VISAARARALEAVASGGVWRWTATGTWHAPEVSGIALNHLLVKGLVVLKDRDPYIRDAALTDRGRELLEGVAA
jgi:hypothetical protein